MRHVAGVLPPQLVLVVLDDDNENDDNGTCQWEYGWYLSSWMTTMMAMVGMMTIVRVGLASDNDDDSHRCNGCLDNI